MGQRVISEWNGPELEYVEPTQVARSFGYDVFSNTYDDETFRWNEETIRCVFDVEGEVAPEKTPYPDPKTANRAIKEKAKALGAAMVGITHVDPYHVYKGHDVPHKYAVIVAVPMEYDEIKYGAELPHVREVLHIYAVCGKIATELATFIRGRGYPARAHTLRFEQINMLPHAYAAGLGELGKHGSLINTELGCSFRVAAVTTDLPLVEDAPKDYGVEGLCANCNMCTAYCPGDAISHEKQNVRGILKWVVDTEACAPYWGSYYACGICLEVCPFNARAFGGKYKKTLAQHLQSIDREKWRAALKAGLQKPWQFVEEPQSRPSGWRNYVRGKGPAAAILMQGIPKEGLPEKVYDVRAAMKIDPNGMEGV